MEPFRLDLTPQPSSDPSTNVTRLDGKLTIETVHNFIATMRADASPKLVLDMSGVSFLDSAGVGALVQIFVHRRAQNQGFALAGLSKQSDAVMTVAGIKKLIPTYESVEQAKTA
jgi:anti-anti-sigma factor